MACRMCGCVRGINEMVGCVGICGGLMSSRMCRYMWGD